jgi:hypothetical protein
MNETLILLHLNDNHGLLLKDKAGLLSDKMLYKGPREMGGGGGKTWRTKN